MNLFREHGQARVHRRPPVNHSIKPIAAQAAITGMTPILNRHSAVNAAATIKQRRPLERPGERRVWRGRGPEHVPAEKNCKAQDHAYDRCCDAGQRAGERDVVASGFDQGAADQNEQERRQEREHRCDRRSEDTGREELIRAE